MAVVVMGIASAVAGGISSIMGAKASAEAAALRNQDMLQKWIQANTQKTINNSRQQFQTVQAFTEQLKRNSAIAASAYSNQFDRQNNLLDQRNFQRSQISVEGRIAKAALTNLAASRGLGQANGTQNAIARAQILNLVASNNQLTKNYQIERENIEKQFKAEMRQQTQQVFMPNIELYNAMPVWESEEYSAGPGMLQMGAAIMGAAAAGAKAGGEKSGEAPPPPPPSGSGGDQKSGTTSSNDSLSYGTDLKKAPTLKYDIEPGENMTRIKPKPLYNWR